MRKIRLDLGRLHVESFEPAARDTALRGTVRANVTAYWELCHETQTQDPAVNTCGHTENSCVNTCFEQTCHQCGGPTAACQTQDPDVNTCGLSCVQRCVFTQNVVECNP